MDWENFDEIYNNYSKKIYLQAFYILNDRSSAEDITQEVFTKLYKSPPRDRTFIGGWLIRVAKNLALNYLRSEKNRIKREEKTYTPTLYEQPQQLIENTNSVRHVLSKMDNRDKTILLLIHSGFTYDEIAFALKISYSSVGTYVSRAQKKFRELYESEA